MEAAPPGAPARRVTLANGISLVRLGAAPAVAFAIAAGAGSAALALFALAVATDLADGAVARRRGESSDLGGLLDHASDAAFATLGLFALSLRGEVPAPLAPLVALAFAQYAFDSRAFPGRSLRASAPGRLNGLAYFVLLGIPLVRDALGLAVFRPDLVYDLGWALAASTLLSMMHRAVALRRIRRRR